MARGINKVILVGNLGANPDVRHMPNGGAVTNVRLATTEAWRDKQTGEQQERTEWHRVVFFNRLAEIAGEYLKTGAKVYIEGSLRTRKWRDNNNVERYTTEIVASDMQMLSGRNDSLGAHTSGSTQSNNSRFAPSDFSDADLDSTHDHSAQHTTSSERNTQSHPVMGSSMDDDDIPF